MAALNLAHYRNSADYEDSVFFNGQPQPWMAGLTEEWRDWLKKEGIVIGSRVILPLPENGSFDSPRRSRTRWQRRPWTPREADKISGLG